MAYCLDADVLINAHRQHFPMDVVPGFWEALDRAGRQGQVFVIHEVYRELLEGGDVLADWIRQRDEYVRDQRNDGPTTNAYKKIGKEITERHPAFKPAAIAEFLDAADPWLVAYCASHEHIVVTREIAAPHRISRVKIPDVCALMGVRCVTTMDLLRTLRVQLVLR